MGTNTDLENAQAWVPTHKAPISMDVQGDPSYIDLTFKSDFTQRLSVYQPLTIKGTSARAAVAFKKYKYPSEKGSLVKLSERHCTSISPRGSEVAVGSSDNAVYIVNVQTGKFVRALASKQWGHTDWVTCVKYMDDGKVLSGGMDSKLCLWEKNMARCSNLVGHGCAISACATIVDGTLGISSSYDKTLKVWDLESSQKGGGTISCVGTFKGHQGPITKLCVSAHEKNIVSGSKLGEVILWDAAEGRSLVRCVDAHEGRVTAMQSMIGGNSPQREAAGMGEMFLTGGQDGILQVWDFRVKPGPVLSAKVHRSFLQLLRLRMMSSSIILCVQLQFYCQGYLNTTAYCTHNMSKVHGLSQLLNCACLHETICGFMNDCLKFGSQP